MPNSVLLMCVVLAIGAINYASCGVRLSGYHVDPQQQQQKGQVQAVGRKNSQTALDTGDAATTNSDLMRPYYFSTGGLSAWGIIMLIIAVILLGMTGYYGIMCYPLICRKEDHYSMMDGASTSSGGTPIRSTEYEKYEKQGNYSSRSTTPSKSHE